MFRVKEEDQYDEALKVLSQAEESYPALVFKVSPFIRGEILGEKWKAEGRKNIFVEAMKCHASS